MNTGTSIFENEALHGRTRVFSGREDAGRLLAAMVRRYQPGPLLLLAIPSGGVPVAAAMARELGWPLEVAVTSKITTPRNSEVGYGAVAFDGTVRLNESLCRRFGLNADDIEAGIARTREKVRCRVSRFRADRPPLELSGRSVMLVDDGIASGFTLLTAVEAVRNLRAESIHVAVPTGHGESVRRMAASVNGLYCANLREGCPFAVADAYRHWRDVSDDEVAIILRGFWKQAGDAGK